MARRKVHRRIQSGRIASIAEQGEVPKEVMPMNKGHPGKTGEEENRKGGLIHG